MNCCEIIENENIFLDVVKVILPFLLGLFSSLFIDLLRNYIKNRRNKKFINSYLKFSLLPVLDKLIDNYITVKNRIENIGGGQIRIPVFEGFNSNVLNVINSETYFQMYNYKFKIMNEIISIIDFLRENLPSDIHSEYYKNINEHLKDNGEVGNASHVETCSFCKEEKKQYTSTIDLRIEEVEKLRERIKTLIK